MKTKAHRHEYRALGREGWPGFNCIICGLYVPVCYEAQLRRDGLLVEPEPEPETAMYACGACGRPVRPTEAECIGEEAYCPSCACEARLAEEDRVAERRAAAGCSCSRGGSAMFCECREAGD